MNFKLITILILLGLCILFIIQNAAVVEISFLFWSFQISRVLFMFFILALGVIIGWILHSIAMHRKKSKLQQ